MRLVSALGDSVALPTSTKAKKTKSAICCVCLESISKNNGKLLYNFSDSGWHQRRCRPGYRFSWRCHEECFRQIGVCEVLESELDDFVLHSVFLQNRTIAKHVGSERPWASISKPILEQGSSRSAAGPVSAVQQKQWCPVLEFKRGCEFNRNYDRITKDIQTYSCEFLSFAQTFFGQYLLRRTNNADTFEHLRKSGLVDLACLLRHPVEAQVQAFKKAFDEFPPRMPLRGLRSHLQEAFTCVALAQCLITNPTVQWLQGLRGKDDAGDTHELCCQIAGDEASDDDMDCADLIGAQGNWVRAVEDQVTKIGRAWDLLRTSHKGSWADAIWHFICHIPGMGGTGFRAAQLAMDQNGWDLLVCGAGSLQSACRLTKFKEMDTNSKISSHFYPKDKKRFKIKTSALDRRLQYLRIQVIHRAITKKHMPKYAECYGADVMTRIFCSVTATQFLLCEYGKSLTPQSREWYIRSPKEREQFTKTFAEKNFAEVHFN